VRTFLTRSRSAARPSQVETAPAAPPLPLIQTIQVGGKQLAGDMGFDPLGLKPASAAELKEMQTKEINNGRLAMLGVAGIIAQELVTGNPIF
jgi:hypothetical protein